MNSWHHRVVKIIESVAADDAARVRQACVTRFGVPAGDVGVVCAPYRLCPLGAHIDHQYGPVSAFATEQGALLAFAPVPEPVVRIVSRGFDGEVILDLREPQQRAADWADYARGAIAALSGQYDLARGAVIFVDGPIAEAGLSSSAAIGLGYLQVLAVINDIELDAWSLVELDRQIENDFMSLKNGILDPAAIALSARGSLTVIDCGNRSAEHVIQSAPFTFLAVFSGLREALVNSAKFNNRVEECLQAGGELRRLCGETSEPRPLGYSTAEEFEAHRAALDPMLARRAAHFFTESRRVREGAVAYAAGDAARFGALMIESCLSSINNYETGCPEIINLFETLAETSGVYGARFCGAGFRGCCVALVDPVRLDDIVGAVEAGYRAREPELADSAWFVRTAPAQGLRML